MTREQRELLQKIESLQDDGSEGFPFSQEELDLIVSSLRALQEPRPTILNDDARLDILDMQEPRPEGMPGEQSLHERMEDARAEMEGCDDSTWANFLETLIRNGSRELERASAEVGRLTVELNLLRIAQPPIDRDEKIRAMEESIRQHFQRAEEAESKLARAWAALRDADGVRQHGIHANAWTEKHAPAIIEANE